MLNQESRNRQLGGFKFARQVAIGNYFADFCVP
jgi:very-short-patch-repair endonuclease